MAAIVRFNQRQIERLEAKGDLFTYSTGDDRLPVGTDGFILTANSAEATGLEWIVLPPGGSDYFVENFDGDLPTVAGTDTLAIGESASSTGFRSIAIGWNSSADDTSSVAIGAGASSEGNGAFQLGAGNNPTTNTLQYRDVTIANATDLFTSFAAPSNYTPADEDSVTSHLIAIDTALGSVTNSPLTTKGDLYTYDTAEARLPVGTDGQILSADSGEATGLLWIDNTDELVKISANDTTSDYLVAKLVAGTDISIVETNDGGNETLVINSLVSNTDEQAKVSANDTTSDYLVAKLVAGTNISITETNDGGNETLVFDNLGTPPTDFNPDTTNNFTLDNTYNYKVTAIDTISGDVTITLPLSPVADGFTTTVYHLPGSANMVTIDPNGNTFRARGTDIVNPDASATIMYDAGADIWYAIGDLV